MYAKSHRMALSAILTSLMLVLTGVGTAVATAASQSAASYSSNGAEISGWNWVRGAGQYATWNFDTAGLAAARTRSIHLNVAALVTNGVNGGSGYSARPVKFHVTCSGSAVTQILAVNLDNPFRPIDPSNSAGVGYAAYGSSSSVLNLAKFRGCTSVSVTASFPFSAGRHVAFNQQAVTLGFSR